MPRRGELDRDYGFLPVANTGRYAVAVGNSISRNSRRWAGVVTLCGQVELDNSRANYTEVCSPPTLSVPLDEHEGGLRDLPMILAFVRHFREHGQVLVHCDAGVARGPAIAIAVLMDGGATEQGATAAVKVVRPVAEPSPALMRQVRAYFAKLPPTG